MSEYPGKGTYESETLVELKQAIDGQKINPRLLTERKINLYKNDKYAMGESLKKIELEINVSYAQIEDIKYMEQKYSNKYESITIGLLNPLLCESFVYSSAYTRSFDELQLLLESKFKSIFNPAFLETFYSKLANLYD